METPSETQSKTEQSPAPPERGRAWRIVAIVLTLHAVLLGSVVLIQGCSKSEPGPKAENQATPTMPEDTAAVKPESQGPLSPVTPTPGNDLFTPEERSMSPEVAQGKLPSDPSAAAEKTETSKQTETPKQTETAKQEPATAVPAAKASAPVKYSVRKGDTLSKIARKYAISVHELAAANGVSDTATLKIKQQLTVPASKKADAASAEKPAIAAGAQPSSKTSKETVTHTVKAGESPTSIAKRYGVSVESLMRANHISDPRKMRVNQKLIIPSSKVAQKIPTPEPGAALQPTAAEEPLRAGKDVQRI